MGVPGTKVDLVVRTLKAKRDFGPTVADIERWLPEAQVRVLLRIAEDQGLVQLDRSGKRTRVYLVDVTADRTVGAAAAP